MVESAALDLSNWVTVSVTLIISELIGYSGMDLGILGFCCWP